MDFELSLPSKVTSSLKGKGVLNSLGKSLDCRSHIIAMTCNNSTKMAISINIPPDRFSNDAALTESEREIIFSFSLNIEPKMAFSLAMSKSKNNQGYRSLVLQYHIVPIFS